MEKMNNTDPIYLVSYGEPFLPEEFDLELNQPDFQILGAISAVNIFVGENNSGKSRLMRALFSIEDKTNVRAQSVFKNVHGVWRSYVERIKDLRKTEIVLGGQLQTEDDRRFFKKLSSDFEITNHSNVVPLEDSEEPIILSGFFLRPLGGALDVIQYILDHLVNPVLSKENSEPSFWSIEQLNILKPNLDRIDELIEYLENSDRLKEWNEVLKILQSIKLLLSGFKEDFGILFQSLKVANKVYIPTLRSLVEIKDIHPYSYRVTVEDKYFTKEKPNDLLKSGFQELFTGQELADQIIRLKNGVRGERKNLESFEKFIGQSFFPESEFEIAPPMKEVRKSDSTELSFTNEILVTINGEERAIHNLGDGIQSIIMLTFPIFNAPDSSWIFIEEPETHLHPGLQRLFMEVLLENEVIKKKNLRFFLTTHSNHLLDLMLTERQDISIFSFRKEPTSDKKIVKNVLSGDQDLLSQLGVQSSSVFIANCSIWVEGITDRLYMRAYLKAYLEYDKKAKPIREDLDYAFFEYAGTNLSHYLFAEPSEVELDLPKIKSMRLSNRILVLADQDDPEKKGKKHEGLKSAQHGNFHYHFYPGVREVENLLHPTVLKEVLPVLFPELRDGNVDLSTLNHSEYKGEYLGTYLKGKLGEENFAKSDIAESGTIGSAKKLKLAEAACKEIKWETMTDEARSLAKKIYDFIIKSEDASGN